MQLLGLISLAMKLPNSCVGPRPSSAVSACWSHQEGGSRTHCQLPLYVARATNAVAVKCARAPRLDELRRRYPVGNGSRLCENSPRYDRTRNFEACGHAQSRETQKIHPLLGVTTKSAFVFTQPGSNAVAAILHGQQLAEREAAAFACGIRKHNKSPRADCEPPLTIDPDFIALWRSSRGRVRHARLGGACRGKGCGTVS